MKHYRPYIFSREDSSLESRKYFILIHPLVYNKYLSRSCTIIMLIGHSIHRYAVYKGIIYSVYAIYTENNSRSEERERAIVSDLKIMVLYYSHKYYTFYIITVYHKSYN